MFNIGFLELLIIVFFFILFVKPEELPKIFKNLGLFYRKINRYYYNLKYEFDEINSLEEISELKKKIKVKPIKKKNKR
tara:strand:+ start:476 stop:709 length:234 start_codon:yes stop_codon:yes gene_type:complete